MTAQSLLVGLVGDVFINRPGGAPPFAHCLDALAAPAILFGNAEGVYSERREKAVTAGIPVVASPGQAEALRPAGFDAMACANNHTMDVGPQGLLDTLDCLRAMGIATVGAGKTLDEANRAAIVGHGGKTVAFLAYSAVFRPGYVAAANAPGIAAMRAHTHFFHPDWHPTAQLEPGTPPQTRTFCYPEDLATLHDHIVAERARCDLVIVSFHWGQTGPTIIHDYERAYGRAAIDAGAHAVVGHHPHFLRGAEVYRGRPIFYGLGHFAFDLGGLEASIGAASLARRRQLDQYGIYPRDGYPLLPFHPDARMTAIAYCAFDDAGDALACLMPCLINAENQPVPVDAASPDGRTIATYLRTISTDAGLATEYREDGPLIAGLRTLRVCAS